MEIQVGKRIATVELLGKEENRVRLSIDGVEHEVDIIMLRDGMYSVLRDGRSRTVELACTDDRKSYKVTTAFSSRDVRIVDAKARYLRLKRGADERQDDKIVSPMPGKVASIPVQPGDSARAGDTVIVIEAMKMQNSYKVASDCEIKEILVSEGETINANQLLMRLDVINA
jgi:biotin carboxyl carrier protein